MKKHLFNGLTGLAFIALLIVSNTKSYASHIYGADLRYVWVSDSTYKIIVALYGDCSSTTGAYQTLPAATPQVCIFDGATAISSVYLTLDTPLCGREITPLCAGDTSDCTSLTYLIPGINKFVYSGTYTLPHKSATWRFVYSGNNGSTPSAHSCPGTSIGSGTTAPSSGGRTATITNLASPGATVIQLIDTLNDLTGHNTNADLTVSQQTIFCNFLHSTYNPTALDADGDSLHFDLVAPTNGGTGCGSVGGAVSYTGNAWPGMPVSATEPLQVVADSFILNPLTGMLTFVANAFQRSIIVYNIEEYRGGVKVGTSQREMSVMVINCSTTFPCLAIISLGSEEIKNQTGIEIFPNPANDELTIKTSPEYSGDYSITNILGQSVLTGKLIGSETTTDIHNLIPGLYYISIKGDKGMITRNFVKR